MEFPTVADMSTNHYPTSTKSTRKFASLDAYFGQSRSSDDDNDDFDVDSSTGTRSPASESPVHKRYLYPQKEFVDELRPEELRWFYRHEGSKKWVPFIGYDSLRIECRYRALAIDSGGDIDADERILVLGGLYEVDVANKKCYPVYWTGDVSEIMQGMWFYDYTWQPLEDCYAGQIEEEHLKQFKGQKLENECPAPPKGPKPVIHNMKFRDFHVDWNATNEIYMYSESTSSKLMRSVGKSLGWQKSGTRLHRGYCTEAVMDDKPPDITHLVFVIHGIGQKMDSGSIVRCCKDLRERVSSLQTKLFPDLSSSNQRAEFLPVQWRSSLKLDGDAVESITPHKMKGVRTMLNSSAMDILYYTSPLYRSEITNSLYGELLRLYQLFCARHPYFEANGGKVSVIAHSLGSVIIYDILTGWNPLKLYDQLVTSVIEQEEDKVQQANDAKSSQLLAELDTARKRVSELEALIQHVKEKGDGANKEFPFTLENLFCLGSPLAVFLALRGIRPQGTGSHAHLLPTSKCRRLFNLYHPSDPVAYRLEPLVLKHYATIMPLPVHQYNAMRKTPYAQMPRKAYAAFKGSPEELMQNLKVEDSQELQKDDSSDLTASSSSEKLDAKNKGFSLSKWFNERKSKKGAEDLLSAELKKLQSMDREAQRMEVTLHYPEPQDIDKTELEYRLDYQLRERSMENSYISLLTSHTSYWQSKDVALFLLVHLFTQLQEELA